MTATPGLPELHALAAVHGLRIETRRRELFGDCAVGYGPVAALSVEAHWFAELTGSSMEEAVTKVRRVLETRESGNG